MSYRTLVSEMRTFAFVWAGQLVSVVGTGLTSFALGVWVYQRTGSATKFALIALFATLPGIICAPLAGTVIDRWDRRTVMIVCDFGSGLCTLITALLLYFGRLEIWHIYAINGVKSIFMTSQGVAYAAATTLLVPKRHLGRAGGMIQLSEALGQILAPAMAAALLVLVNLWGVILIDFLSFLFAVTVLFLTRIPGLDVAHRPGERRPSLWRSVIDGWTYITSRPGLLSLLMLFAVNNFLTGFVVVLGTPLILSFASVKTLATLLSSGGCGMLAGSLVMSAWGGPKRRVYGVLGFYFLVGVCVMLIGIRPWVPLIGVALFFLSFSLPLILGSSQVIWQSKVAPEVQGRVFAARRMLAWSTLPLAYLLAGPLADRVFEPLLAHGGLLANSIGQLIGVGRGRGIALLYIVLGLLILLTVVAGYLYPRLRLLEDELPDMISDKAAS